MREEEAAVTPIGRGAPIVATWARIAASASIFAAAFVAATNAYVTLTHGGRTLGSLAWLIGLVGASETILVVAILRAEEARLVRELRTARTGTAAIRGLIARRRQQVPILGRLFSTQLGVAAVFLADGNRTAAVAALAATSPLMQGGRIEQLRAAVDADAERASGTASGLERCIGQLRGASRLGNREADLYCRHVLVKAVLEVGDADMAVSLASELDHAEDDEERMYATWLRVWFDLDVEGDAGGTPWPPLAEGQARLAALVARAQGAERLVDKLEERLLAIAHPERRE
jgi:hypothetical protein